MTRPTSDELEDIVADLLARYVERRDAGATPCTHDLLAVAAEFGSRAVDALRAGMAFYEVMRDAELG